MSPPGADAERYHAFDDPVQDKLLGLILALGAEVWVLKDRLALLEAALDESGTRVNEVIDRLAAAPEHVSAIQRERSAFLERFLRALGSQG